MSTRRRSVSGKAVAADPPSHRLRWSKRAEADLVGIDEYISADDPVAAARWIDKLTERARTAALMPYAGRVVPEFRMEALREVLVRSYRIVYRIRGKEVQVITVFEGHRLFPSDVDVDSDTE